MNEWVYVLTVEALIFGLLSTILTAQRIDVFTWPKGHTWPVFGTGVLLVLAYSLSLVLICNFIKASRLHSLAEDISHALARSAGRLVTVTTLWVIFQSVSVYTFDKRDWLLVLCQLWGTTCNNPGAVFWELSYSVYLSVLLPLLAWFGGLQVVVCGRLASEKLAIKTSTRRITNINILSILLIMSAYTIKENFSVACKDECPVGPDNLTIFDQQPGAKRVMSMRVLLIALCFLCTDVLTGVMASFVYDGHSRIILGLLIIVQMVQISALPFIVKVLGVALPETIMWVVFGLACALGLMDVCEVCARWFKNHTSFRMSHTVGDHEQEEETVKDSIYTPVNTANTAFSIEKNTRKRFQLSLGGKGMWPYTNIHSSIIKMKMK
jgi:hypothetical protein